MRWAPADYVNDPSVKLALAQRDFVSATFWPLFLFHAFIQGGELPAEPTALGAILGMRPVDIRRAVAYWTEQGKLKERDGRLYHERICRDIADEIAFREEQSERGVLSWKARGRADASHRLAIGSVEPAGSTSRFNRTVEPPSPSPLPEPSPDSSASPRPVPVSSSMEAGREVVVPARHDPPARLPADRAEAETTGEIRRLQNELGARLARLSEHPNSRDMVPAWSRRVTSYKRKDGTRCNGVPDYRTVLSIDRLERSIEDSDWWLSKLDEGPVAEAQHGTR
jgi:hypothetical protein